MAPYYVSFSVEVQAESRARIIWTSGIRVGMLVRSSGLLGSRVDVAGGENGPRIVRLGVLPGAGPV